MWILGSILQLVFFLFMLSIISLFLFSLLVTWAWAQSRETETGFKELVSTAAVEWGAIVTLVFCHFIPLKRFHEAPPLKRSKADLKEFSRQVPIIFVPSLHTGPHIFLFLIWRLKKNYFTSLWPFQWKSFLVDHILLEDQLSDFIGKVLSQTDSPSFRMLSFGSSYPLVHRVLSKNKWSDYCDRWVVVSSASGMSSTMKFISTARIKSAYSSLTSGEISPRLSLRGTHDCFVYPESLWPNVKSISIAPMGHYGTLLHSTTVRTLLEELR